VTAALRTVRLCDEETSLEATFVPEAGMLCCSLRHRGEELLAQNAGVAIYAGSGKTMGIPLLYPWANRLAGFDYVVGGRAVAVPHDPARVALDGNGLPIHGVIGGRQAWQLTGAHHGPAQSPGVSAPEAQSPGVSAPGSQSPAVSAREAKSLAARLSWDRSAPERFEVFPFRHDLHYEARLGGGRLEVEVTVHACGADVVPVAFGFHPYLSLPGTPRERWLVELPSMRHLALDADQIPTGPAQTLPSRRLRLGEREFDDGFDRVPASASFSVAAGARRIVLDLLEGYPCAQVFAPRDGQYICFEPMTAPTNALRSGLSLRLLSPGERYRARFAVSVQADLG
jgi:aldose 1-epimerase